MLDLASLVRVLGELRAEGLATRVDQYAYRSIALRHFLPPKRPAPLSAATAGRLGTRFVPPDRPTPSLSIAAEVETAYREGNRTFFEARDILGEDPARLHPPEEVVLIGLHVRLARMLDVRDPEVVARLETTPDELIGPWKTLADAPTQRLGHAVESNGQFEGLIYRSARHAGGTCLVVFPERLDIDSSVAFRSRTGGVPNSRLGLGGA